MVQNPKYWRAKQCDKTPLGSVNNEKSHFSSQLCFVLESGAFFWSQIFWILYHVTSSCKGPIWWESSEYLYKANKLVWVN